MKSKYIALITSTIAIIVTIAQGYMQYLNKSQELKLAHIHNSANFKLAKLHENRNWKLSLTDFMAKYRNQIFSNNVKEREKMRKIMMVSFPLDIMEDTFSALYQISNKKEWEEATILIKKMQKKSIKLERGRYEDNPNSLKKAKNLPKLKECEKAIKNLKLLEENIKEVESLRENSIGGSDNNSGTYTSD